MKFSQFTHENGFDAVDDFERDEDLLFRDDLDNESSFDPDEDDPEDDDDFDEDYFDDDIDDDDEDDFDE